MKLEFRSLSCSDSSWPSFFPCAGRSKTKHFFFGKNLRIQSRGILNFCSLSLWPVPRWSKSKIFSQDIEGEYMFFNLVMWAFEILAHWKLKQEDYKLRPAWVTEWDPTNTKQKQKWEIVCFKDCQSRNFLNALLGFAGEVTSIPSIQIT